MKATASAGTYVLYPDEGHGFARPQNRIAFYAIAEGFLSKCLGGRTEPIGNDFAGSSLKVEAGADYLEGLPAALKSTGSVTCSAAARGFGEAGRGKRPA